MLNIRTCLAVMTVAVLLPMVVFSAIALHLLKNGETEAALRGLHETARVAALLIDRKLADSLTSLEQLGQSPLLKRGDLQGFYNQAAQLDEGTSVWTVLLDESGQQMINTAHPFGKKLPAAGSAINDLTKQVTATRKATASDLLLDPSTQRWVTVLFGPVLTQGGKRYVLTQFFTADVFSEIVVQRNAPRNSIVAIMGRDGRFIARNFQSSELVGRSAAAALTAFARASPEGLLRHNTVEGVDSYNAFQHSEIAGWTVSVAAPVDSIEATAGRAVAIAALGFFLAIAAAALMAVYLGRRAVRGMARLADAAVAIGQGAKPKMMGSNVLELNRLHETLMQAGETLARANASRRQAEREREELLQNEYLARLRAEDESIGKDQFLAMLGHELRNPLAAIGGALALSKRHGHATAMAAEARAVIQRQSEHLSHLVDDLLDVSRMVGKKIALKRQQLDLAKTARACLESVRATGRTTGYTLKITTETVWIQGDSTRLEQIVNNLLINAFKFTPQGGLVDITVGGVADQAVLTIKDSGTGISAALLPHIFEVFVQGTPSLDRSQGGLGIGLALVHELVSLHGGTVSAESAGPGQGSTFIIRLPRVEAPVSAPVSQPVAALPAPALPAPERQRRWRILLIEDNDDARSMMKRLLEMEGHEIFEASTGPTGLQMASLHVPDLAIVDIGLPEMTGYEVAQRLRANADTQGIGLIAMTGYGQEEDRENAMAAGFDFHLVKSVGVNCLLKVLDPCAHAARLRSTKSEVATDEIDA